MNTVNGEMIQLTRMDIIVGMNCLAAIASCEKAKEGLENPIAFFKQVSALKDQLLKHLNETHKREVSLRKKTIPDINSAKPHELEIVNKKSIALFKQKVDIAIVPFTEKDMNLFIPYMQKDYIDFIINYLL